MEQLTNTEKFARHLRDLEKDYPRLFIMDRSTIDGKGTVKATRSDKGFFQINGWREYGTMQTPYVVISNTMTDDLATATITTLVCDDYERYTVRDLPKVGDIMRLTYYNRLGDETDSAHVMYEDHDKKILDRTVSFYPAFPLSERRSFSSWYVESVNPKYFYKIQPAKIGGKEDPESVGSASIYKVNLVLKELTKMLQDFPIRSTKVFAEGDYTYREILNIAFELAFRPRQVGKWMKTPYLPSLKALDRKNRKMSFTNATLYDVVKEIARQIDMRAELSEVGFGADGVMQFYLDFRDKYGADGKVWNLNDFDWAQACSSTQNRNTNAGSVVCNAQNIKTRTSTKYPHKGSITALDSSGDETKLTLPTAIDQVNSIRVFYKREIDPTKITENIEETIYNELQRNIESPKFPSDNVIDGLPSFYRKTGRMSEIWSDTIRRDVYLDIPLSKDIDKGTPVSIYHYIPPKYPDVMEDMGSPFTEDLNLFLYERELYNLLPETTGENFLPAKDKSIVYDKGSKTIDLGVLKNYGVADYAYSSPQTARYNYVEAMILSEYVQYKVAYAPVVSDATIIKAGALETSYTAFYNQQSMTVLDNTQSAMMGNYVGDMSGTEIVRGMKINRFKEPFLRWTEVMNRAPRIGDCVMDGKVRYTITEMSTQFQPASLEVIVKLKPYHVGRSEMIFADYEQRIFAIPDGETVASNITSVWRLAIGKQARDKFYEETENDRVNSVKFTNKINKAAFFGAIRDAADARNADNSVAIFTIDEKGKDIFAKADANYIKFDLATGYMYFVPFSAPALAEYDNGKARLYTDGKGRFQTLYFQVSSLDSIAPDQSQIASLANVYKDSFEIAQLSLQVDYVGEDDLILTDSFKDYDAAYGSGKTGELWVYMFDRVISPSNLDLTEAFESYKIKGTNQGTADGSRLEILVDEWENLHIAFVMRNASEEEDLIMIDNSPQFEDGKLCYYLRAEKIS